VLKRVLPFALAFALGAIIAFGIVFYATKDSGAKLNAELSSTRASLEDAARHVESLGNELRSVSKQLEVANGYVASQKSTIDGLHNNVREGQRISSGILDDIENAGSDFRKQLVAYTNGFESLYEFYNKGSK
jgi:hypothetical protein